MTEWLKPLLSLRIAGTSMPEYRPYSKSKLELESNSSEFCRYLQGYMLFYLNLIWQNSHLSNLAFGAKKERYKHRRKIFTSLEFDFFRVQLKFVFRIQLSVSGWCGHGFKSYSQPFFLTYPEAGLSLWSSIFYFCIPIRVNNYFNILLLTRNCFRKRRTGRRKRIFCFLPSLPEWPSMYKFYRLLTNAWNQDQARTRHRYYQIHPCILENLCSYAFV